MLDLELAGLASLQSAKSLVTQNASPPAIHGANCFPYNRYHRALDFRTAYKGFLRMRHRRVMTLVPLLVSGVALAGLLAISDLGDFSAIASSIRWTELPGVLVMMLLIIAAFSWRWNTLLRERLGLKWATLITSIGLAGNQLLPLRGGDALRVVLSGRRPDTSIHAGVSALALEKVFDLVAVAAIGSATVSALVGGEAADLGNLVIVIAAVVLIAAGLLLIASSTTVPLRGARYIARRFRLSSRLYRHLLRPIQHLRLISTPRRLVAVLGQTGLIWFVLYGLLYVAVGRLSGVPLAFSDVLVLLFASGLGLAIPAAPSGLGTFHAALVSAFLLLGRTASEGMIFAVAAHAVFFFAFCAAGVLALTVATRDFGPIRAWRIES